MKHISIIGGGFGGTNTAIQLIKNTNNVKITIINDLGEISKGIAYNPYSDKQLLNVITSKMSAFYDEPNHFLDWVMNHKNYKTEDREIIGQSFLSRKLYGEYLLDVWNNTLELTQEKNISVNIINSVATNMFVKDSSIEIITKNNNKVVCDYCVIATGNYEPKDPYIKNMDFYKSNKYYKNPWSIDSVKNLKNDLPVLIIGNGLTMVDTVIGLEEQGFKNKIYSISPNGFNILSHKHIGLKYTKLIEELTDDMSLFDLVKLINKHIKNVKKYGISAEPIIDSLRPYTQKIWNKMSKDEKTIFMSKLRHLWGVARHRIPQHIYEKIQKFRLDNKLNIISGRLLNIDDFESYVGVEFFDKKNNKTTKLKFSRIINCTGPNTDISQQNDNDFLKNCLISGIIKQDDLKLGICANTKTYQVINSENKTFDNIFTIGSLLKGELWESTAVNEIRNQSVVITKKIING